MLLPPLLPTTTSACTLSLCQKINKRFKNKTKNTPISIGEKESHWSIPLIPCRRTGIVKTVFWEWTNTVVLYSGKNLPYALPSSVISGPIGARGLSGFRGLPQGLECSQATDSQAYSFFSNIVPLKP